MGVNIIVCRIVKKTMEDGWNDNKIPFYETARVEWWDSLRHSGDKDFIIENKFDCYDDSDDEGCEYVRPNDFNKCREWIKKKIFEGNQPRLLKAMDEMEKDKSLTFHWSW